MTETTTITIEKIGNERPWVAKITGRDLKYGLSREFVDGVADYTGSNSKRTRGVMYSFALGDGIYEVKGGESWSSRGNRSFLRVCGGSHERITLEEVMSELVV